MVRIMHKKNWDRFIIGKTTFLGEWNWNIVEKCMVCALPIKDEEKNEKVYCPHCRNPAHENHLIEWIKLKGICPLCRKNLSQSDILSI